MRGVLYIIIFTILSFFAFSCDLKIKTWEDEEHSTPGSESVNVNKGFGKENEIRLLFNEQIGRFSLFINSIHECDFYLDGIRTANDLSYYLSVSTNSSDSVVEFHLEEGV